MCPIKQTKTDKRYQILFDHSPISIWEEDFSFVRDHITRYGFASSEELVTFFQQHPEKIKETLSMIKVVDVNQTSLKAWNHVSKDPLIGSLQITFDEKNINSFIDEIKAIYEGILFYQVDDQQVNTENGERRHLSLYWSVVPGHEDLWDQVLVSAIDITNQKITEQELAATQISLSRRVAELEKRNLEMRLLSDMLTMLQMASEVEEAYSVIGQYFTQLFEGYHGALLTLDGKTGDLTNQHSWGGTTNHLSIIKADDCWALRTGKPYFSDKSSSSVYCPHIHSSRPNNLFCIPISIDNNPIGCLTISTTGPQDQIKEDTRRLALTVVEQIDLSLTNLHLRQHLRQQAIHDVLTGLYNRTYLEETFERELYRQERSNQPLSLLMIDLDHLKRVNDIYGHAAGDAVLHELGKLIKKNIRASDMPCRYGGDEFVLLMPDTKLETAIARAEKISETFRQLSIPFGTQTLGDFSLSIGVACAPIHGHTSHDLLAAADKALYEAKKAGRDRVIAAEMPSDESLPGYTVFK